MRIIASSNARLWTMDASVEIYELKSKCAYVSMRDANKICDSPMVASSLCNDSVTDLKSVIAELCSRMTFRWAAVGRSSASSGLVSSMFCRSLSYRESILITPSQRVLLRLTGRKEVARRNWPASFNVDNLDIKLLTKSTSVSRYLSM